MIRKNPSGFIFLSLFLLSFFLLTFSGCGGSSSSPPPPDPIPDNQGNGTLIKAVEGGSVTCGTESSVSATLKIPPLALKEDTQISVKLNQTDNEISIEIEPQYLQLLNPASLTIDFAGFSDTFNVSKLFDVNENEELRPLKQKYEGMKIEGTLYMFNNVWILSPDDSLILEISDNLKNAEDSSEWQELFTSFNALMWLGAYYRSTDDIEEATACITTALFYCKNGADLFLKTDIQNTKEYINALEKIDYLMGICENPGDIKTKINAKYSDLGS